MMESGPTEGIQLSGGITTGGCMGEGATLCIIAGAGECTGCCCCTGGGGGGGDAGRGTGVAARGSGESTGAAGVGAGEAGAAKARRGASTKDSASGPGSNCWASSSVTSVDSVR
jgi:hypothetical protein